MKRGRGVGRGPRRLLWAAFAILAAGCGDSNDLSSRTRTPIEHVIVVIGENRSFDALFATYVPPDGQRIWNLRSLGIVDANGNPGPSFARAAQQSATNFTRYELSPTRAGPYATLPQPNTTLEGRPEPPCVSAPSLCPDPGLGASSQELLFLGGTGQPQAQPDCRYPSNLPNGPYQITGPYPPQTRAASCGNLVPVLPIANDGDPVHNFFQMWQQSDCNLAYATPENPSGCLSDLYTWVAVSVGWAIGRPPTNDQGTAQGGVAMGFYNMAQGDLPYFRSLARTYAISDNHHQFAMGGTMSNSFSLATADVLRFNDADGNPVAPPADQVIDPDPVPGSNNFYENAAFGLDADPGDTSKAAYVACADRSQPGVGAIRDYLDSLPYPAWRDGNCDPGTWYVVANNYPSYRLDGSLVTAPSNAFPAGPDYTVGPSVIPTIGDALSAKGISWSFYGEGASLVDESPPQNGLYCVICNPFQYSRSVMTTSLRENIRDIDRFFADVASGHLPAVSYVKPDGLLDGHPGSSTPPLYEAFVANLVRAVQSRADLWSKTAIFVTLDEGGGEYDSGYIQPIDFFGDGPRTVMIAVSPYAKPGFVDHTYADHASVVKFIEHNWRIGPLSERSRDNLPNPIAGAASPYVPDNSPAIGDLTTMFDF